MADTLADYQQNGEQHYVFALANVSEDGSITDLRPKGSLSERAASDDLAKHEKSTNHPDASLESKGFVRLSSATDSDSENIAATSKAVKAANDNADKRLSKSGGTVGGDLTVNSNGFIEKQGIIVNADNTNSTNGLRIIGRDDLFADIYHYEQPGVNHRLGVHVANGGADGWFEFWHNNEFHVGDAIMAPDGNIYGSKWSGWLSAWLDTAFAARDNSINNLINYVNGSFIVDVRLAGEARTGSAVYISVPGGCVMTGLDVAGDSNATTSIGYRAIQKYVNGQWYNVGAL